MRGSIWFLYSLFWFTGMSVALDKAPVPPTEDEFYVPPDGYEDKPLGAILRHREVNKPGFLFLESNIQKTVQILYRSSNSRDEPMATVTTVLIPENADSTKLLSYQIYEDSSYLNCAPSYGIQFKADPEAIVAQAEFLFMASALNKGWMVVTPDYQGPHSAFLAGRLAGRATLDSIRATLDSGNITGIDSKAKVALWGYSGGSLATGWATELQPSYAPELELTGAAMGGYVTNLTDDAYNINKGPFVGFIPAGFFGLSQEYPEFKKVTDSQVKPSKKEQFNKVGEQCIVEDGVQFAFQDFGDYFKNGTDILKHPTISKIYDNNSLGHYTPNTPLFIYHSKQDEIIDISNVERVYNQFCSQGATIDFVKDETSNHITEAIAGSADAFNWLDDRLSDKSLTPGCRSRTTFSTTLDNGAPETFGYEIASALKALLGIPIGPKSIA
jgi:esterase/lipase